MSILFSKEFGIPMDEITRTGVFDVFLDEDSHFFINIKRLQETDVSEFVGAYNSINEYFREIGLILKSSRPGNKLYREALKRFNFPEVNGINLGFSAGRHGAGFGEQLRNQIIADAYEIIQSGSEQPEIFHLTSLFEENVGPDRLSDMFARLIYNNILAYTKRIYQELKIVPENYPAYQFSDGLIINPYKQVKLLLLPVDILHELPIARCWDDINRVCRENEAIRDEINSLVGNEWSKMASSEKKRYLRDWIFKNPKRLNQVINSYRTSSVEAFDVFANIEYLVGYLKSTLIVPRDTQGTSFEASCKIVKAFREWVEYHRGSLIIKASTSRSAEKTVQRTIHATAIMYCKENNWDISPEEDGGRGPVDFKISRGNDKTVIEIKLTSNRDCVHGYETQIEEYAKAESTEYKVFVLIDTGEHSERVQEVEKKRQEMIDAGKFPAHIVVIDSKPKESASKYKP
jgi:hypothetical protein